MNVHVDPVRRVKVAVVAPVVARDAVHPLVVTMMDVPANGLLEMVVEALT